MSYKVYFDTMNGAVRAELYGVVPSEDMPKIILEAILLGQEASSLKRIYDLRQMEQIEPTVAELFSEHDIHRYQFMDNTRVAVMLPERLINNKSFTDLFSPFFGNSPLNYAFFTDDSEALRWLRGLQP